MRTPHLASDARSLIRMTCTKPFQSVPGTETRGTCWQASGDWRARRKARSVGVLLAAAALSAHRKDLWEDETENEPSGTIAKDFQTQERNGL